MWIYLLSRLGQSGTNETGSACTSPAVAFTCLLPTAKDRLDEFLSVQPAPRPTPPGQWIQWQAQPQGMVKINFDGAISTKTLSSGIGVVVRDDSSSVLGALS